MRTTRAGRFPFHAPPTVAASLAALLTTVLVVGCGDAMGGDRGADAATIVPDAEEVFRIGSVSGGRWESFSDIVSAGFDVDGRLYLLDGRESTLTVVGPDGGFLRTMGAEGDGPGEFRRPLAMAVLPDGRVVVSDGGHRGLLLFDADGAYDRTLPFPAGVTAPSTLLADGEDAVVYAGGGIVMTPMMRGGTGAELPSDVPVYRVPIDDEAEPEVIHRAWLPPRVEPNVESSGGMMRMTRAMRAFEPELHVAVLPGGTVAVADSTAYRIDLVEHGDGLRQTLDRSVVPTVVTDREREREKARRLQEIEDGGGEGSITVMGAGGAPGTPDPAQVRAMREAQLEGMIFWPEIQVIQELAADREGRLWVRTFGDVGEPGPIEILRPDGTPVAVIPAGEMAIPAAFGPDRVAAWIERDEYDVPFVRVARLEELP